MPSDLNKIADLREQHEIIQHLIDIFGLPPFLQSLKIEWDINSILTVDCRCVAEKGQLKRGLANKNAPSFNLKDRA